MQFSEVMFISSECAIYPYTSKPVLYQELTKDHP